MALYGGDIMDRATMLSRLDEKKMPIQIVIEKWQDATVGKDMFHDGVHNCAFCELYLKNNCKNCPIFLKTGFANCKKTPYQAFAWATNPVDKQKAAMAMLEFVRSLQIQIIRK